MPGLIFGLVEFEFHILRWCGGGYFNVSKKELLLGNLHADINKCYILRVRPEGGFKKRKWKPVLPKHNSGSYYRNRNIFFNIPVLVNLKPEFQILVLVSA